MFNSHMLHMFQVIQVTCLTVMFHVSSNTSDMFNSHMFHMTCSSNTSDMFNSHMFQVIQVTCLTVTCFK